MPIGILVNVSSLVLGGLVGGLVGHRIPEDIKQKLNWVFGVCAMVMGISSVILMKNMPAVIFSVIVGTIVGLWIRLGQAIDAGTGKVLRRFLPEADEGKTALMVTAVVLFCASGTGIYGSLDSGMTGNHTILLSKAILDFFTGMIFACQLGTTVSLIAIPQAVVMLSLFCLARVIVPLTTPVMVDDFKACGGFLLLATSFRMMQLRMFPIADMIPAMVIVMPVSYTWTNWIAPLL